MRSWCELTPAGDRHIFGASATSRLAMRRSSGWHRRVDGRADAREDVAEELEVGLLDDLPRAQAQQARGVGGVGGEHDDLGTPMPSALSASSGPLARAVAEREVEHEDVDAEAADHLGGVAAAVGLRDHLEPGLLAHRR